MKVFYIKINKAKKRKEKRHTEYEKLSRRYTLNTINKAFLWYIDVYTLCSIQLKESSVWLITIQFLFGQNCYICARAIIFRYEHLLCTTNMNFD